MPALSTTGFSNSGLFSWQEFKNRGVIKLGPDALVYIGGSLQTQVIAPVSGISGSLSFNDGITAISVQNNVDPPGSSTAHIEVATPVYGSKSNYWVSYADTSGNTIRMPVFVPMMEVKIFFKGRFPVNGSPKYYPAFWGFISQIEETYSGGLHKISLACVDILHWWAYSTITVHPIPASLVASGGGQYLTAYSTIFEQANPFTIIRRLFQNMGMNEFVAPTWLAQITPLQSIYPPDQFRKAASGIMAYWNSRFQHLGNLLKMYGLGGEPLGVSTNIDGQTIGVVSATDPVKADNVGKSRTKQKTQDQNVINYSKNTAFLTRFTPFFEYEKMGKFDQAETLTKLAIATEVKTRTDYEFYQDTNGNFIFKPPFYNIDIRGIPSYEIEPHDIVSSSFGTDIEPVCTVLQIHTAMADHIYHSSFARGEGFHMDIDLAQKYGIRFQEMNVEYIADPRLAKQMAVAQMALINSKALTGTVTVPGRPEMRLGYPVFIRHRDAFQYVKAMTHSFDYAGSFTTSLSLEIERRKVFDYRDNPNGVLQKNKIYLYSGKVLPDVKESNPPTPDPAKMSGRTAEGQKEQELLQGASRVVSLQEGLYQIKDGGDSTNNWSITGNSVPFTDEFGYRVIGSFPYGRGMDPQNLDNPNANYSYTKIPTSITVSSWLESVQMGIVFNPRRETVVPQYMSEFNITSGITDDPYLTPAAYEASNTFVGPLPPATLASVTNQNTGNVPAQVPTMAPVMQTPEQTVTNIIATEAVGTNTTSSDLVNAQAQLAKWAAEDNSGQVNH